MSVVTRPGSEPQGAILLFEWVKLIHNFLYLQFNWDPVKNLKNNVICSDTLEGNSWGGSSASGTSAYYTCANRREGAGIHYGQYQDTKIFCILSVHDSAPAPSIWQYGTYGNHFKNGSTRHRDDLFFLIPVRSKNVTFILLFWLRGVVWETRGNTRNRIWQRHIEVLSLLQHSL